MTKHVLLAALLALPLAVGSLSQAEAAPPDSPGSTGSGSSGSHDSGWSKGTKSGSQTGSTSGSSSSGQYGSADSTGASSSGTQAAAAVVKPATGNKVQGKLKFTQEGQAVKVSGEFSGLQPNQKAQFMIHEKGDCSGDLSRAGDEFEPAEKGAMASGSGSQVPGSGSQQGAYGSSSGSSPSASGKESEEYGLLKPDSSGRAQVELTLPGVSLTGSGENSLLGRSIVVHSSEGTMSRLTEGSGKPLACGVINSQQDDKSGKKITPKRGG